MAFPPRRAVGTQRDVRVDRVALDHRGRVRIGASARPGRDAEEARFRIHRPQPAIVARPQPGDIVTHGERLPSRHRRGRHEHREIGLAARGRKRRRDVVQASLGILQAEDQHVLGEPALLAREPASETQRHALLAEQGVSAIPRADRPDRVLFGEMDDEAAIGAEIAERVQAAREIAVDARLRIGVRRIRADDRAPPDPRAS